MRSASSTAVQGSATSDANGDISYPVTFSNASHPSALVPKPKFRGDDLELRLASCERRLSVLTRAFEGVAGALIHCDDMALRERDVLSVFPVLLYGGEDDVPVEHHRKTILLRRTVQTIMESNGLTPHPVERRWWKSDMNRD